MSDDSMSEQKTGLVPRLRFPEFREAGEWEENHLDKLLNQLTKNTETEMAAVVFTHYTEDGSLPQDR